MERDWCRSNEEAIRREGGMKGHSVKVRLSHKAKRPAGGRLVSCNLSTFQAHK